MTSPEMTAPVPQIVGEHISNDQLRAQMILVELDGGGWSGPVPDDDVNEG